MVSPDFFWLTDAPPVTLFSLITAGKGTFLFRGESVNTWSVFLGHIMHRMFWKTLRSLFFKLCHSLFCFGFFSPPPFSPFPNLSVVTGVSDNTKAASVYARKKLLSAPPVSPILFLISAVRRACFDPQTSKPTSHTRHPCTSAVPQLISSWSFKKQNKKPFQSIPWPPCAS